MGTVDGRMKVKISLRGILCGGFFVAGLCLYGILGCCGFKPLAEGGRRLNVERGKVRGQKPCGLRVFGLQTAKKYMFFFKFFKLRVCDL